MWKSKAFNSRARKKHGSPARDDREFDSGEPTNESDLIAGFRELIEAEQNSGYPDLEAVPDDEAKAIQELLDCEDFANALRLEFGFPICDIEKNPESALPDCFGRMDGQRLGIEVTRLTITPGEIEWQRNCLCEKIQAFCSDLEEDDPERARRIRTALATRPLKLASAFKHMESYEQLRVVPPRPAWRFDYFQARLRAVVCEKEDIAAKRAKEGRLDDFDKLFLLVRTNEYLLTEYRVDDYVRRVEIPALRHFDAAFLMLPARPIDGPGRHSCPVFQIAAS